MQNSLSSVLLRISSHVKSLKHLKFSHLTVNDSRLRGSLFISRRSMTDQAFNFSSYHSVGFDLDNCLVRYDVKACLEMEYQFLAEFLVDKGYTRDLLQPIEKDQDFLQKGLILDFKKGNLMRICPDGTIQICSHGTKKMTKDEVLMIYKNLRWSATDEYSKDMLCAWNGDLSLLMRSCLDIFDMPAALAFARIIDSVDASSGRQDEYDVWPDILEGLMTIYGRENFDNGKSKYFQEIRKNTEKYVLKNSSNVTEWLKKLKNGRKTFLVTGSNIDFANLTATIALGSDWRDYFDFIVTYAKKPGFFTGNRPFLKLDGIKETEPVALSGLKLGGVYSQGNFAELKEFLLPKNDPKILYVGDNLIQDVFTPSFHLKLDSIAIVEELLVDGDTISKEYEILHSTVWGNYFHTSGKSTFWESVIRNHSKICVASIEHLAQNPIDYSYKLGYYPKNPNFDFCDKN